MKNTDNVFCLDAARQRRKELTEQREGLGLIKGVAPLAVIYDDPMDKAFWQRAEYKKSPANASAAYRAVVAVQNKLIGACILASAGVEYYKSARGNEKKRESATHNRPA